MKKSKLLLILALVVVLALGVLVSCKDDCAHENYGAWMITKAPTLTDAGEAVRICADCGVADTVTVAKLSDTSVWTPSTTSATHTTAGKTTYTSTYGTVEIRVDALADHVYDKEVVAPQYLVSAADCDNAAVYRKSCVCGAVGTATFTSGNALGHDGKAVAAVDAVHTATTLTNGTKAHYACDRCGKLYSDAACTTEVTAASLVITVAHSFGGWTLVSDATCTTEGSLTHACTTCGKVETDVIPAHDHDYSSNLWVVVTSKDTYQEEDGSIVEGDEEATEFHAPVCDICKVINKDAKVAHTYSDWNLVIRKDHLGHEVIDVKTCSVCNYSVDGDISRGYLEHGTTWTAGETVAATYTSDGYTEYTSTYGTVRLVLPKLVAPYEGKTYNVLQMTRSEGSSSFVISSRDTVNLAINSVGAGKSDASPFRGDVVITMSDPDVNEVTITVTNGTSVSTYVGYVEPLTGIMVVSDNGFMSEALVVVPYSAERKLISGSQWGTAMAMSYHIDCGVYTGHDVTIFVNDDEVIFGVTFEDANGALVAADECTDNNMLVVKGADGNVIVTLVKNSNGVLQIADSLLGTYAPAEDTLMDMGTLVIDGIGGFTFPDADSPSSEIPLGGTYTVRADGKLDLYVIIDGLNYGYFIATLDTEAMNHALAPQMITITLDAGEHGTVEETTITTFANCILDLPEPTVNAGETIAFLGWMNGSVMVTDTTTFSEDVTLVARWAGSVVINVVDTGSDVEGIVISVETPYLDKLPAHVKGETINSKNNTMFAGWYLDADYTSEIDEETIPGDADADGTTVYAKWIPAGTWTSFRETPSATFVYNPDTNAWRTSIYGSTEYHAFFDAIDGDIVISFTWWIGSTQSWDTISIKNNGTTLTSGSGSTLGANVHKTCTAIVKEGTSFEIVAKYYSDSKNDTYGVFVSDLTINGRPVTAKGTADLLDGTYTSANKDNLVLNGYGGFTWGNKSGIYTKAADNAFDMYVIDDGKNVEYYVLTLDGTTYSVTKPMVTITFDVPAAYNPVNALDVNKNIAVNELPDCTSSAGDGKVFVGWYTKDGADDDWGNLVTTITLTEDVTLYARWVTPHALFGTYNGFAFGSNATTTVTTVTVNELGVVTSSTMKNAVVDYDAETGAVWFVNGSTKYYGIFDATTGNLVVNASSSTDATIGSAPYVLFRDATVANQKILVSKNAYKAVAMEVDGTDRIFLLDANTLHVDVDVVVNKADGTSVSDIETLRTLNSSTNGFVYVVSKDGTHLVSISYMVGIGVDICDGTEGMYANGENTVWVLGIGGIMMDGKLGKLVAVDGQENTYIANIGTTSSATPINESYVITLDVANKTYTIADNKVAVTFNFAGLNGSVDALSVYAGVETTLPAAPAITGYTFRGWYNNQGLTGSAITKVTPTEDTVIYAKYDKAITVTIVYGNGMTDGSVTDKFANDTVTVALPDGPQNDLYPVGYFTTSTFDAGSEWTSGSAVTDDLTIYLKWTAPHALTGIYTGAEFDATSYRGNTVKTITVEPTGKVTGYISGTLTAVDEANGVYSVSGMYLHYDKVSKTVVVNYGSSASTSLGTDLFVMTNAGETTTVTGAYKNQNTEWYVVWDNNYTKIGKMNVNGVDKLYFVYNNKVYGDVVVNLNGTDIMDLSTLKSAGNVITITQNEVVVFKGKYDGTTFVGSDGKQGTYTGTGVLASIELDGYGFVTIGSDTVAYTLDDNKITFVLNNRMMVIELGDGTCAQVQDGYAETYALPGDAGTITLDGLGGAGDGATYVVNGNNITVYTATGSSTTYGLDVANKTLLGKSVFAGLTFRNGGTSTSHFVTFDDDVNISGTFYLGNTGWWVKFTGELTGNTLILTVTSQQGTGASTGATIEISIAGDTLTVVSPNGFSYASFASNKTYSCEGFSLPA